MKNVTHLVLKRHIWGGSVSALCPPLPPSAPVYLHRWDPAGRCIGSTRRTRCPRPRVRSCDPLRFPASPWGPSPPVRRWSSRQEVWTLSSGPSAALPRGDLPSRHRLHLSRRPSSRDSVQTRGTVYSRTRPPPGSQDWRVVVTDAAGQPSPSPRPCWLWRPAFWPPAAARCPPELRRASPGTCGRDPPGMPSHPGPDSVSGRTSDWSASRSRFAPRRTAWKQRVWRRLNDTGDDTGSCVAAERVLSVGEQVEVVVRSGSSGTMQRNDDFKKYLPQNHSTTGLKVFPGRGNPLENNWITIINFLFQVSCLDTWIPHFPAFRKKKPRKARWRVECDNRPNLIYNLYLN